MRGFLIKGPSAESENSRCAAGKLKWFVAIVNIAMKTN